MTTYLTAIERVLLLVPLFIGVVFLLMFGLIATTILKGLAQWVSNNCQPVQNRRVRVATKRLHVSGGSGDSAAISRYHATFEDLETSERQEFQISSTLYSGIGDGDNGQLTHQGTRFLGFQRERNVTVLPPTPPPSRSASQDLRLLQRLRNRQCPEVPFLRCGPVRLNAVAPNGIARLSRSRQFSLVRTAGFPGLTRHGYAARRFTRTQKGNPVTNLQPSHNIDSL